MGTFGYNCRMGKCDFLPTNDTTGPQVIKSALLRHIEITFVIKGPFK